MDNLKKAIKDMIPVVCLPPGKCKMPDPKPQEQKPGSTGKQK